MTGSRQLEADVQYRAVAADDCTDEDTELRVVNERYAPTWQAMLRSPRVKSAGVALMFAGCLVAWFCQDAYHWFQKLPAGGEQHLAHKQEMHFVPRGGSSPGERSGILATVAPPSRGSVEMVDDAAAAAEEMVATSGDRGQTSAPTSSRSPQPDRSPQPEGITFVPKATAASTPVPAQLPDEQEERRQRPNKICGGSFDLAGYGKVHLVNAAINKGNQRAGAVEGDGYVMPHMMGRTYFSSSCSDGPYEPQEYIALKLLGRTLRYTVDLSGVGCGCNAALYLTSLAQNTDQGKCGGDFYCDANEVCGVRCAEIDIQEANSKAWLTTLHSADDGAGEGGGYGAYHNTWSASDYGPGARCIDTRNPFSVSTSFPVDSAGVLEAVEVMLTQPGKDCPLTARVDNYSPLGLARNGLAELTPALKAGMTPIISYWGLGEDLSWFDGRGPTGNGPCDEEGISIASCSDAVKFTDFSLE